MSPISYLERSLIKWNKFLEKLPKALLNSIFENVISKTFEWLNFRFVHYRKEVTSLMNNE